MPLRRMNAMTTSIASADSISDRSWFHRFGSPGALVSSVVSSSGISGSSMAAAVPSGSGAEDGVQHRRRVCRNHTAIELNQFAQPIEQCRERHEVRRSHAVLVTDVEKGPFDLSAHMPSDSIRRVGSSKRSQLDRKVVGQIIELYLQTLRDNRLVQTRTKLLHGQNVRPYIRSARRCPSSLRCCAIR